MTIDRLLIGLMLCIALVGCGGGGATGSGPNNSTLVAITAANQRAVASAVTDSDLRNFGSAGTDQAVGAIPTSGQNARVNFLRYARPNLAHFAAQTPLGEPLPVGIVPTSGTKQCVAGDATSGTVRVDYIDNGDNQVSSGDALTITYNNCLDPVAEERLNGVISFTVTSVTGTPSASTSGWSITANLLFSNFSVTPVANPAAVTTVNGGFTLTFSQDTVNQSTSIVAGANLSVLDASGTVTWTNFSFTFVENDLTGDYEENGSGSLSSSTLGGRVSISVSSLSGSDPNFPDSGSIKIIGTQSSLALKPQNSTTVRLELDLGDNGSIDATQDIAWSSL